MSSLMSMRLVSEPFTGSFDQKQCNHLNHHVLFASYYIKYVWRDTTLIYYHPYSSLSTQPDLLDNRLLASTDMIDRLRSLKGFPLRPAATMSCPAWLYLTRDADMRVRQGVDGAWQRHLEE